MMKAEKDGYSNPFTVKQGTFLIAFAALIACLIAFSVPIDIIRASIYFYALMLVLILTGTIRKIPLYRKINWLRWALRYFTVALPIAMMLVAFLIENRWQISKLQLQYLILGALVGLTFLFVDYHAVKKDISGVQTKLAIRRSDRIFQLGITVSTSVCEELFFRGVLLFILYEHIGILAILIVSIAFFLSHYLNWSAAGYYSRKAYFLQFALSITTGLIFVLTQSLAACIIAHIVFNAREIYILCKRPSVSLVNNSNLFNDY